MQHTTIAVDLAKSVFQVAVSHRPGQVDQERRLSRSRFLQYLAQQPPALVLLEACGSARLAALGAPHRTAPRAQHRRGRRRQQAHYWARELQRVGHTVRLLPAHDVHRYVRRNKTDRTDTKALLEANRNEEIYAVPVKTVDQQAIASLHRLRSTWLATRTARLNTVRGLLREFGVNIPVGAHHVVPHVRAILDGDATPVPAVIGATLTETCNEVRQLETNIRAVERQLPPSPRRCLTSPCC